MKNAKVKKSAKSHCLAHVWGKTVRTNGAKWGSSSITKRTYGVWFGLLLAHLTFFLK
jgi:hypothetical protein